MKKSTIEDLRSCLMECIDKYGIIEGKRRFSLQIGTVENTLFNDLDEINSSIYHFEEYIGYTSPEDANLEELPVVDEDDSIVVKMNAVS